MRGGERGMWLHRDWLGALLNFYHRQAASEREQCRGGMIRVALRRSLAAFLCEFTASGFTPETLVQTARVTLTATSATGDSVSIASDEFFILRHDTGIVT